MIAHGLVHPSLRDEVFVQLMKQLTRNTNRDSVARGLVLLELCLVSFPPSEELENFVEAFLRVNEYKECLRALHLSLFRGPRTDPPSLDEIRHLCERRRCPEPVSVPLTPERSAKMQ